MADSYQDKLKAKLASCNIIDKSKLYAVDKDHRGDADIMLFSDKKPVAAFPYSHKLCSIEKEIIDQDKIIKEFIAECGTKTSRKLDEFERKVNPVLEELIIYYQPSYKYAKDARPNTDIESLANEQPKPDFLGVVRNGSDSVFASITPFDSFLIYSDKVYALDRRWTDEPSDDLCIKLDNVFCGIEPKEEQLNDFLEKYSDALSKYERWIFFNSKDAKERLRIELDRVSAVDLDRASVKLAAKQKHEGPEFGFEKLPAEKACKLFLKVPPWSWDIRKIKKSGMDDYANFQACKVYVKAYLESDALLIKSSLRKLVVAEPYFTHPFIFPDHSICTGENDDFFVKTISINDAESAVSNLAFYLDCGRAVLTAGRFKKPVVSIANHERLQTEGSPKYRVIPLDEKCSSMIR